MALLLVNFGGPRHLGEIEPFLCELLCDRELIRTRFPNFLHQFLFRRIAKKRAPKIRSDYESIGGRSPIFETTEALAKMLRVKEKVLTFHRYLPSTHAESFAAIEECEEPLIVFPFFPQYSFATTGSIATLFKKHLSDKALHKLRWIPSYPTHPAFLTAWKQKIRSFLKAQNIDEKELILLFSAHGLPETFIEEGDPYQKQCESSVLGVLQAFPDTLGYLAYQSKFGKGEWLKPYTEDACRKIKEWCEGRKTVVFIPIAFTSDHIETLYEIEQLYLPIVRERGFRALRCPALNLDLPIAEILATTKDLYTTSSLLRSD